MVKRRDRTKAKGRSNRAPFLSLNHPMLDSEAFCSLSPRAVKMLVDVGRQYNGSNNGDLSATRSQMLPRGWTSNDQRQKAIRELLDKGFLIVTRYGYRPRVPTLYAITWQSIDHCGGMSTTA